VATSRNIHSCTWNCKIGALVILYIKMGCLRTGTAGAATNWQLFHLWTPVTVLQSWTHTQPKHPFMHSGHTTLSYH